METPGLVIGSENGSRNGSGAQAAPDGDGGVTGAEDLGRLPALVESLLFAAGRPVPISELVEALDGPSRAEVLRALEHLVASCEREGRGLRLVQVAGGWQLRTPAEHAPWIRRLLRERPPRLSRPMLETLAIVAYRQPVTRPEMEDLRGVDCGAVTRALLERKLIRILGKKDEPGRPLLYGTTREFLELFNLRDLTQLPTLREFQELSEESRRIVEEEAPPAPGADLFATPGDPAADERIAQASAESDAALDQLEKAMERAGEQAQAAEATLAPAAPKEERASPATGGGQRPQHPTETPS